MPPLVSEAKTGVGHGEPQTQPAPKPWPPSLPQALPGPTAPVGSVWMLARLPHRGEMNWCFIEGWLIVLFG